MCVRPAVDTEAIIYLKVRRKVIHETGTLHTILDQLDSYGKPDRCG